MVRLVEQRQPELDKVDDVDLERSSSVARDEPLRHGPAAPARAHRGDDDLSCGMAGRAAYPFHSAETHEHMSPLAVDGPSLIVTAAPSWFPRACASIDFPAEVSEKIR